MPLLGVRKLAKDGKEKIVNSTTDIYDKLDVSFINLFKYSFFTLLKAVQSHPSNPCCYGCSDEGKAIIEEQRQ